MSQEQYKQLLTDAIALETIAQADKLALETLSNSDHSKDLKELELLYDGLMKHVNEMSGKIRQFVTGTQGIPAILSFDSKNKLGISVLENKAPWIDKTLEAAPIPGMISAEECKYYNYIGQFYSGKYEIVELGPWVGRSTFYILKGLLDNPNFDKKKIYVYDDFVWRSSWMNGRINEPEPDNHQDFQFIFDRYMAPFKDYMLVEKRKIINHDGNDDVPFLVWNGKPIEMLYVDIGRDFDVNEAWYKTFYDSLIPDKTLIVMQDWGVHREVPVKSYNQIEQFTDSKGRKLQLVHELLDGCLATFLYR